MKSRGKGNEWLLIKKKDFAARPGWNAEDDTSSVTTGNIDPAAVAGAVRREIYFRERREIRNVVFPVDRELFGTSRWSNTRRPLTAKDIGLHANLAERLTAIHHERHGLWPKLRRFFFHNRLCRWLGL